LSKREREKQETDLLQAFKHPLRRTLFREVSEAKAGISPVELATKRDEPLSNICYHVRVLADRAAIVCFKTVPVSGSIQHFYKVNPKIAGFGLVRAVTGAGAVAA
jgi:hypothetical protein